MSQAGGRGKLKQKRGVIYIIHFVEEQAQDIRFKILLAYGMIIACEESFLAVVTTVLNGFDVLHCAAV
jgi:hypothetical protein